MEYIEQNVMQNKVIKALKTCVVYEDCKNCPYKDGCVDDYPFSPRMLSDALWLLESQQTLSEISYLKGYCHGRGKTKRWKSFEAADAPFDNLMSIKCPSCNKEWTVLYPKEYYSKPKYCPWCGGCLHIS